VPNPATITAADLAAKIGAQLLGPGDVMLRRIDALEHSGPGDLAFIRSYRYAKRWPDSKASAALIARDISLPDLVPGFDPANPASPRPLLIVPDADLAAIACAAIFAPTPRAPIPGVHASAVVHAEAVVPASASIGPNCTIEPGAHIGEHAVLIGNVFVGQDARIGAKSILHPGVSVLDRCVVGERCIIHAGAAIGADGFGYRPAPNNAGLIKIPHVGNVVIGNDVEIGANTCIDRAKFGATLIGDGSKIDNLVQIAHNCRIGRSCVICGHTALAGSVVLGDGVLVGGAATIADNLEVGPGAKIAAAAGIMNDVPAGAVYLGSPAGPAGEWRRIYAQIRRLGKRPARVE